MPSLEALLKRREGFRKDVYLDSRRRPTVGIGHLVTSADKLKVGDKIEEVRIWKFFRTDSMKALSAARSQASKAKIQDHDFLIYLASVNYQLGPAWNQKLRKTWDLILKGKYTEAAAEAQKSTWHSQTPDRVKDFQGALLRLAKKSAGRAPRKQ
jgi:GH24 family phage-related lysozyme (muramidase)